MLQGTSDNCSCQGSQLFFGFKHMANWSADDIKQTEHFRIILQDCPSPQLIRQGLIHDQRLRL